jgi:hypothetical protein
MNGQHAGRSNLRARVRLPIDRAKMGTFVDPTTLLWHA